MTSSMSFYTHSSPTIKLSPFKRAHVAPPTNQHAGSTSNFSSNPGSKHKNKHKTARDEPIIKKRHIYSDSTSEDSEDDMSDYEPSLDINANLTEPDNSPNEPKFSFDEVKMMIDKLLDKQRHSRGSVSLKSALKNVNFDDIATEGRSADKCKDLVEQLVKNTRRIRTLQEILLDIRDNLEKRSYTEIIHRATIDGNLPRRPPSSYLLYHQDRYQQLRSENNRASEVSKKVAEEWKEMSAADKAIYVKRHSKLLKKYESEIKRLGLDETTKPKRSSSAKQMYIKHRLGQVSSKDNLSRSQKIKLKEEFEKSFEALTTNEKNKWISKAEEDKARYLKEKEAYIESHPHLNHSTNERKKRGQAKPSMPDRPKSALKIFLEKNIKEYPGGQATPQEIEVLKAQFSELTDEELLGWVKKALKDKARYERQLEQFKLEHPDYTLPRKKDNITKDQLKIYERLVEERPTQPSPNAYLHYCGGQLAERKDKDKTPTERMQVASEAWKSAEEKRNAEKQWTKDIKRYVKKMTAWLASQDPEKRSSVLAADHKANPEYWQRKLDRMNRAKNKLRKGLNK